MPITPTYTLLIDANGNDMSGYLATITTCVYSFGLLIIIAVFAWLALKVFP